MFWRDWDPIGINNSPSANEEYDRYADRAYVMLMDEQKSAEEIATYLYWVASEHMGLGGDRRSIREDCEAVAKKLAALLPEFETASNEPF